MKLIDTHCHIHDLDAYKYMVGRQKKQTMADFSTEKILGRMAKNGVKRAICVGTTHEDSLAACRFASWHDNVYFSYGIHPEEANEDSTKAVLSRGASLEPVLRSASQGAVVTGLARLRFASLMRPKGRTVVTSAHSSKEGLSSNSHTYLPIAIGEVGLDYHSEGYDREEQIRLLEEMVELAIGNDLPMIFHVREAFEDFFAVLDNFHGVRGVVHSFSDTMENMEKALSRGFYIGVNGLATWADLPMAPIKRVLLETDSPFLAPVPFRGRVNEPSHILDIAKWVSEKYHLELEEVAEITTRNAEELFGLED